MDLIDYKSKAMTIPTTDIWMAEIKGMYPNSVSCFVKFCPYHIVNLISFFFYFRSFLQNIYLIFWIEWIASNFYKTFQYASKHIHKDRVNYCSET